MAVSAGFDGHVMDPLLQLRWTDGSYHLLGQEIRKNFKNVFAILEGGYNTDVLPTSIDAFRNGMEGKKYKPQDHHPNRIALDFLLQVE